jgi:hypothetical protein
MCVYFSLRTYRHFLAKNKRCNADCGLGQECHWINGEEMCVCSPESCTTLDSSGNTLEQQSLCASNNMTFNSPCSMEAWKCLNHQSALYKKYDGQCQSKFTSLVIMTIEHVQFVDFTFTCFIHFNRRLPTS